MTAVEVEPAPHFQPCCRGGWWLSGEMPPADEDAQPETD
jgi:hypothetical protein